MSESTTIMSPALIPTGPAFAHKSRRAVWNAARKRCGVASSTGQSSYDVAGTMPDGTWKLDLYERKFRISVTEGHISQVKLRCVRGFVRFTFDPTIEYSVENKYGSCRMELDGNLGTRFILTQF